MQYPSLPTIKESVLCLERRQMRKTQKKKPKPLRTSNHIRRGEETEKKRGVLFIELIRQLLSKGWLNSMKRLN